MIGLIAGLTCGIATFYGVGDGFDGRRELHQDDDLMLMLIL